MTKAFDSIDREILWKVLHKFRAPDNFVQLVKGFHSDMYAEVLIGSLKSEPFSVDTGVKQGCVPSSLLFSLYITAVINLAYANLQPEDGIAIQYRLDGNLFNLRRLQAQTKTSSQTIHELQYADDNAIPAPSPEALQRALDVFSDAYAALGLSINPTKTEVL